MVKQPVIQTVEDICKLIAADDWMMEILRTAQSLHLPDWWVCAGFVRSKVWDTLHGYSERTPLPDVDVIYYDANDVAKTSEQRVEDELRKLLPSVPWSVKNQARMHLRNHQSPYASSVDAISKFPETATAIGVRLNDKHEIELTAPWGVSDLVNLVVRPTLWFSNRYSKEWHIYRDRVSCKKWTQIWPLLRIDDT